MTRRPEGTEDAAARVARLYDRCAARMYRYAAMILADTEAAADVVQQVFVAVLQKERRVHEEDAYLRRAVRNACVDALRRRRREAPTETPLIEPIADGGDPAERVAVEEALRELPADQREVIHLKVFEGMTFQEIADLTGESINTVASRYRYATAKLRARLGQRS